METSVDFHFPRAPYKGRGMERIHARIGDPGLKIELTPEQAAVLRPIVANWEVPASLRPVFIGQLKIGAWPEPEKTLLLYTTISPATAAKIRKLIEKDHAEGDAQAPK